MDLPNFKDILQKLSVFKNKALLIPVVIVLVSILLFIPTQLMSSGLKKKVQTGSVSLLSRINSLREKAVSEELLEKKKLELKTHAEDANEISRLAKQTTQRQLLNYDIFDVNDPNSLSGLVFLQFGKHYTDGMDTLITNSKTGDCPTQTELTRAIEASGVTSRSLMGTGRSMIDTRTTSPARRNSMQMLGLTAGLRTMSEFEKVVVDEYCLKRAQEVRFYITPAELSGYQLWKGYDYNIQKVDAVEDCWYYQLAYWVIEDIFNTMNTMNSGHENVLNAPVKRFMSINFTMDTNIGMRAGAFRGRGMTGKTDAEKTDKPVYVLSSKKETMLSEPCTGRYSNEDIDVIHFNFGCIVSTKDFMPFIQELCSSKEHKYIDESGQEHTYKHNQISVLETNIYSVDKQGPEHMYYRYGDGSVLELDLICEYIFKKDGYEDIKPQSVQTTLLGEEE